MKFELIKCSSPGWVKAFASEADLVEELRSHVCMMCRFQQNETYEYFNDDGSITVESIENPTVDVRHPNGTIYECRDIPTLLGTACGCEFIVEIDGKSYFEYHSYDK